MRPEWSLIAAVPWGRPQGHELFMVDFYEPGVSNDSNPEVISGRGPQIADMSSDEGWIGCDSVTIKGPDSEAFLGASWE